MFRFNLIVEIREDTDEPLAFSLENVKKIADVINRVNQQMSGADSRCYEFVKLFSAKYFPDYTLDFDGTGYNVLHRIREQFYGITLRDSVSAKAFLEKLDKVLYDYRFDDKITLSDSEAYIEKVYFRKKVETLGHDIVAYDLLKNLNL